MVMVATFYAFAAVPDCQALQPAWKKFLVERGVTGTIVVTPEGINATIAGPQEGVGAVLGMIRADKRFAAMAHKESFCAANPFMRTKVKVKRETVPLGVEVNPERRGDYVAARDWNALVSRGDVMVVDCRNDYEVRMGAFVGAANPATRTFRQLPKWLRENVTDKKTKVAMYCTGGIRCEKSTAYMKARGFGEVYHLEGGILKYLEEVPEAQSLWRGACYVFDDRVAVGHDLKPVPGVRVCRHCTVPINAADVRRAAGDLVCGGCLEGG